MATAPTAAAPVQAGMRRIPLPLESYELASLPLSAKRLVNFYAEKSPADARSQAALVSQGGLTVGATYGTGPILAINAALPGRVYVVSGTHLWRVVIDNTGATASDLGDIGVAGDLIEPAADLRVTLAVGPTAVVVCVPPNAFTCTHTGTLNQIGGDFPGARSVAYIDGYFCFTSDENSSQFYLSKLLDPAAFDALDFAYADAAPNVVNFCVAHLGEIWLMGAGGIEIWYDSGDADFPLRRRTRLDRTALALRSVAAADGSLFWVAGDGMVYRTQGYQPTRVSTHAIETIIDNYAGNVITAFTYSRFGHTFYVLTVGFAASGTQGRTLVYDCATSLWHERSSTADGTGRWAPMCAAQIGATPQFGDSLTGQVYVLDQNDAIDVSTTTPGIFVTPPLWAGTNRAFCSRLEIEMEVGAPVFPDGTVLLEWSDDGGWTWTGARTMTAGASGERRRRVYATRLGSFRQRVFRVTVHGHATIYGIDADISAGSGG